MQRSVLKNLARLMGIALISAWAVSCGSDDAPETIAPETIGSLEQAVNGTSCNTPSTIP